MLNESGKKKVDLAFPRLVLVVFIGVLVLAAYPLASYASVEVTRAAIAGAALGLANVLAGYAAIEYAIDGSYTVFLKVVLGGMGVRLFALLGGMLLLIKVFHFHPVPLVISLLVFYTIYLFMEIMFIQKKMNKKAEG